MELQGKIKFIGQTKTYGAKGFRKREMVITTDEKYPQHIPLEVTQENCDYLDQFSIGEKVDVKINVRGREWKSPQGEVKYFLSLEAWKVSSMNAGEMVDNAIADDPDNDLPF